VTSFKYIPLLIESLDHKDFYGWASHFDVLTETSDILFHDFIIENFTNLPTWYNKDTKKFKKKNHPGKEKELTNIKKLHEDLQSVHSKIKTRELLYKVKNLEGVNCSREDLLHSIYISLENAHFSGSTVLEAMKNHRNTIRKMGRKLYGKCIGTTLLTKGLEFDTVIVLDADNFKDSKNLYVALSRCSKRLIVVSNKSKLNPY
jgi:DNA helicase-2/ATP-dependent DNA helicase PcrA